MRVPLLLLCVIMLVCCKKSNTNPADIVQQMRVLEYKTNTPLAGVKVDMYSCIPPPGMTACDTGHLIFSGLTDTNGIIATSQFYHAAFGITLTKDNYITAPGGAGDRYMYPAAYLRLHLIKDSAYADTTAFVYYTDSTLRSGAGAYTSITPPPADTIISLQLPGDSTYTITYGVVIPVTNCTVPPCYPQWLMDTTTQSLNLAKFGDSTITIRY
jgi:hypothetical protein